MNKEESNSTANSPNKSELAKTDTTSINSPNNNNTNPSINNMNPMAMMNPQHQMSMLQMQAANMGGGMNHEMMAQMMSGGNRGMMPQNNNMGAFASSFPQGGGMDPQVMAQMMRNKRAIDDGAAGSTDEPSAKRANTGGGDIKEDDASSALLHGNGIQTFTGQEEEPKQIITVPPSREGKKFYSRNDVLCGRGGGTNVHPGNRRFRDLINANRRAYLKARKNDKPAISRSIVRTIREMNGGFLKKDEKAGLWFEIGDDGAREKTSQALRQRAPEMRKILFEDEQRQVQQSMMQRQTMMMGMGGQMGQMNPQMAAMMQMGQMNPAMFAAMQQQMGGGGMPGGAPNNMSPAGMNAQQQQQGGDTSSQAGDAAAAGGGGDQQQQPADLLAKYNMLHQKNWLAQEKNILLQKMAMAGMNPSQMNGDGSQSNNNQALQQALLEQGMKPVTPRGA